METVREWGIALCAAAVLCAAGGMIAPDGKQAKYLKTIMSAVVLCVILSPVSMLSDCSRRLESAYAAPVLADSELSGLIEEQTATAMSDAVSRLVRSELEGMNICPENISVSVDISPTGSISIGQVEVVLGRAEAGRAAEVSRRLYDRLGLNAAVTTEE